MPNIKGTIVNVKDFLSQKVVNIKISGSSESVFELGEERTYFIPDFQREIRWTPENLIELMNDIYHQSKFLGNIILTKIDDKKYAIIDGQQRTTLLLMLIKYVSANYGDELPSPPQLCSLLNEGFPKYETFQDNCFSFNGISKENEKEIRQSDQYNQIERFQLLWKTIAESEILPDSSKARDFLTNLYRCEFNIILSEEDSTNYSIEYFLDVNLKGVKLDSEDIFKGYLFHLDPSDDVRKIWVSLKKKVQKFNEICGKSRTKSDCYPIMKLIEHFLYSYIYDNSRYSGIVFGEDFCLRQKIQIGTTMHYVGEHILKVVNNNKYIRDMLMLIIRFLDISIDIVSTEGPSESFKELFKLDNPAEKIDHDDIANFHKFIKMILMDKKVIVSKAIIIKYLVNTLLSENNNTKRAYKELYTVQMYVTLFSIFENKKGIEPVAKVLKSHEWEKEMRAEIKNYCNKATISERKRGAEFKFSTNPENEEQRYHSIALAAVYNYFVINGDCIGVKKGKTAELRRFLTDSENYSTEHFITNKSGKSRVKYCDSSDYFDYEYQTETKKYASSIFNYIYIPKELNKRLENMSLQEKLNIIEGENITCEYSTVVIAAAKKSFAKFPKIKTGDDENNKRLIDRYYAYDFKQQQYSNFTAIILKAIAERFGIE